MTPDPQPAPRATVLAVPGFVPPATVPLALEALDVSPHNTRKNQDAGAEDASLDDLASNLDALGLINAVTVRPAAAPGRYEVIAGGRRVAAARRLGWASIPAVVREDLDDAQALVLSLAENVHRADMHPLDKARAYEVLLAWEGTVSGVARITGISGPTVARYLQLLKLPPDLQAEIGTGVGPAQIVALAELTRFETHDAMRAAWRKVRGLRGGIARDVLKRSGGSAARVDALVDDALVKKLDRQLCGSSLDTCPFLPPALRPAIRDLLTAVGIDGADADEAQPPEGGG
jgi:ParB/RepB/Spo0J family partition protein